MLKNRDSHQNSVKIRLNDHKKTHNSLYSSILFEKAPPFQPIPPIFRIFSSILLEKLPHFSQFHQFIEYIL